MILSIMRHSGNSVVVAKMQRYPSSAFTDVYVVRYDCCGLRVDPIWEAGMHAVTLPIIC